MTHPVTSDGLVEATLLQLFEDDGVVIKAGVDRLEDGSPFVWLRSGDQEIYLCNAKQVRAVKNWLSQVLP